MSTRTASRDDRGTSLVEASLSMLIIGILGIVAVAWLSAAGRSDQAQEGAAASSDALREAKASIVTELRFADSISTNPALTNTSRVTVWIDSLTAGTQGAADAGIGEWVTWEITTDGRLMRITDAAGAEWQQVTRGLVTGTGGSAFSYPSAGIVGIRLVAASAALGASPQTIETQVRLRNA